MSIQTALSEIVGNLEESIGKRDDGVVARLAPRPHARDTGRRPDRQYGQINIDMVIPDPTQPRNAFDENSICELSESIKSKGQLSPIRVRWCDQEDKWVIIAGERRWRAARQAGLKTIACYFHERDLTNSDILEEQLIENIQRQQLTPLEEAKAFKTLIELNHWTGKQLAKALAINPATVCRSLALLKLPEKIQQQVDQNDISARTAYELSRLDDVKVQDQLAARATSGKLTHDQAARHVPKRRRKKKKSSASGVKQIMYAEGDWTVTIANAKNNATYAELEQALLQVLEEVRLRIDNNVQLI